MVDSEQLEPEHDEVQAHAAFFATHGFVDVDTQPIHSRPARPARAHHHARSFTRVPHGSVRAIVLWALAEKPMHGYQIISELRERTAGFWTLSPGSVYPTLQHLADEGLVTAAEYDGRRIYTLTPEGRGLAQPIRDSHGPTPWLAAKGVGERRFRIWRAASELATLAREAALSESAERSQRALDLLERASSEIHAVLGAGDDAPSRPGHAVPGAGDDA